MKRIIKFQKSETDYQIVENDKVLFSINIVEMKFDVKDFYYAFFSKVEDIENIQIENTLANDKEATRVYNCINQLFSEIIERFKREIISNSMGNGKE